MKLNWQLPAAFVLGLALGLAWKPYHVQPLPLNRISGVLKWNRLNGHCWVSLPGEWQWRSIESRAPEWAPPEARDEFGGVRVK